MVSEREALGFDDSRSAGVYNASPGVFSGVQCVVWPLLTGASVWGPPLSYSNTQRPTSQSFLR